MNNTNNTTNTNTLINDFIIYLKSKGRSKNTITGYSSAVEDFFKATNNKNINEIEFIKNINKMDINKFNIYLQEECNNSESSRCKKLSSLKAFLKYLVDIEVLDRNIMESYEMPKLPKRKPVYMNLNQAKLFLDTVDKEGNIRDLTIFTVLLNTGLRISELINLNVDDIKGDNIRIIGKGDKERFVYLNPKTQEILKKYIEYRVMWLDESKIKEGHEDALFLSKVYRRITKEAVESNMKIYLKKAGLSLNLTPHKLRHTFASIAISNGADIREVQELLGHEDISTTQIYAHLEKENLQNVVNKIQI